MKFILIDNPRLPVRSRTEAASAAILLIIVWLLPLSCRKPQPPAPPPPQVEVIGVQQKDVPIEREWVSTLDGYVNAVIRAQVTGYLIKQNYKEGEHVTKGQVLFEIDPRPFEAARDQAKGALRQAEAQYQNAKENLERVKPLAAQKALSKRELDQATAVLRTSSAQVTAAKAAVKSAQLNLGFTKITSPIDGIAGIAQAQVGNLVGPAQTGALTTVSTIDPIKVSFTVPEQDYIEYIKNSAASDELLVKPDKFKIQLKLSDGSIYPKPGKFYAIDRQVDPRTGTLTVETVFPNPDSALRPGQFGRVRLTVGTRRGALLVPQRAVTEMQGRFQVAIVSPDNKVEIKNVQPGNRFNDLWEINQGLRPGERVVAEGVQKIKQGMAVSPVPYSAQTGTRKTGGQAAGGVQPEK